MERWYRLLHRSMTARYREAGESARLPATHRKRVPRPATTAMPKAKALASLAAGALLLGGVLPTPAETTAGRGKTTGHQADRLVTRSDSRTATNVWININPGGGGAFTSIGAGPTGIIVAGSDLSGAYRSKDRGLTWDVIGSFRGLAVAHVSTVAFDPQDGRIIYIGTEAGIYRSSDSGDRFTQVLGTGYIGAIAVAPGNPSIIYAGWHPLYNATQTTVYKSTDRGQTWKAVATNIPGGLRVLKLLVDASNPDCIYLLSGRDRFVPRALNVLYRSVDGGIRWSRLADALGDVWDVALDPASHQTLYLTTYQATPGGWSGFVCKSVDGGATWTRKANRTGAIFVRGDRPHVIRTIDVQRNMTSDKAGVWESTDGGTTWDRKSEATTWDGGWQDLDWAYGKNLQGLPKTIGVDLSDPNVMYWADAQFVFAAFDGARFTNLFTDSVSPGWWRGRGIDNVAVIAMAQSEADPQRLYAGFYDLGIWRSLDGGNSWQSGNSVSFTGRWKGHGGNTTTIVADPDRPDVVWATNGQKNDLAQLVLIRSTDAAAPSSWTPTAGLPLGFIAGLSLDRTSPAARRTLFVTDDGDVYRSQDDGQSWSLVFANGSCRITAVDRYNGRIVYAGGEGGLWRSTKGGEDGSWVPIGNSEMSGTSTYPIDGYRWPGVHQIVPDMQESGGVYVVSYGTDRGLYRSTDRGTTWTKLRTCSYCRELAIDRNHPSTLYLTSSRAYKSGGKAAGAEGVLRSTDGGQTWISWNEGLAWPFAGPIIVDAGSSRRVFVGSPGTGFFRRTIQ